jgi:hypothetical protein
MADYKYFRKCSCCANVFLFAAIIFYFFQQPLFARGPVVIHDLKFEIGDSMMLWVNDNTVTGINLNINGTHVWDWTWQVGWGSNHSETDRTIITNNAAYPDSCPWATRVVQMEGAGKIDEIYIDEKSDGAHIYGMVFDVTGGGAIYVIQGGNTDNPVRYPSHLHETWTDSYWMISGGDNINVTSKKTVVDTGQVTVDAGGPYPCAVIQIHQVQVNFSVMPPETLSFYQYDWYIDSMNTVCTIRSTNKETNPNFTTASRLAEVYNYAEYEGPLVIHDLKLDIGDSMLVYVNDNTVTGINLNIDGTHIWDWSSPTWPTHSETDRTIHPDSAAYPDSCPLATRAMQMAGAGKIDEIYIDEKSDGIHMYGYAFDVTGGGALYVIQDGNTDNPVRYPSHLYETWTDSYWMNSGGDAIMVTSIKTVVDTGQVTVDAGGPYPCAVIQIHQLQINYSVMPPETISFYQYDWYIDSMNTACTIRSTNKEQNPNFTTASRIAETADYWLDNIPPIAPYITKVEKLAEGVKLYWHPVTTDTLGNPENVDYYVVYRNTSPDFIPGASDSIGYVNCPDTTYTDTDPLIPPTSYYLVKAVDFAKNKSEKSYMGYRLSKFVNENPGATGDRNWVSIPWHSEYARIIDLTDDLSPTGTPLSKITKLGDNQTFENWIHHPSLGWYGDTFDIESGRAYEMLAVTDDIIILVGSNDPDGLIPLNENPGAIGDRNWVSIPYNASYSRVIDITDEYSSGGEAVTKITNLRNDQIFENWIYHPVLHWYGDTFDIIPGRAYEMLATVLDTTWNPTEYTNRTFMKLAARRHIDNDVDVHLGSLTAPDRTPVWMLSDDQYVPAMFVKKSVHREAGVSHVVRADLKLKEFDNLTFTAYRPDRPRDVLTENIIGCGTAAKNDLHVLWFDAGNFMKPWEHGEEIILIVEALKQGKGYFTVLSFKLDKGMDIQELGELVLMDIPELIASGRTVSWNMIDNDHVIGYSVYQGDRRMNEQVITANEFSASDDAILKPMIKGGYETVFGSHGSRLSVTPISYAFSIYPNPFVRKTHIDYALPELTSVEVKIYDVSGQLVRTVVSGKQEPGYYNIIWQGDDDRGRQVSAGVYFIQINAKGFESQQKIIFVR